MSESGKGSWNRGTGAPRLGAPSARGEAWRTRVMTRTAAAVAAEEEGAGARGERENAGCAIGADPWQSVHSLVGLRPGQVRGSGQANKRHPYVDIRKGERGQRRTTDQEGRVCFRFGLCERTLEGGQEASRHVVHGSGSRSIEYGGGGGHY